MQNTSSLITVGFSQKIVAIFTGNPVHNRKPPQPVHQTNSDGVNSVTQDTLAPRLNDQRLFVH